MQTSSDTNTELLNNGTLLYEYIAAIYLLNINILILLYLSIVH